jgi:integrase
MALSGARIGEVAQLWGSRIVEIDGIHVMRIAPAEDGGTLKNEGSERDVPIHPAIIERGFLDFVKQRGSGPLFYGKKGHGQRHASKPVANHLAAWIREQGFTDGRGFRLSRRRHTRQTGGHLRDPQGRSARVFGCRTDRR